MNKKAIVSLGGDLFFSFILDIVTWKRIIKKSDHIQALPECDPFYS